jgi:23S rRNA pseudouridine2605 synthase
MAARGRHPKPSARRPRAAGDLHRTGTPRSRDDRRDAPRGVDERQQRAADPRRSRGNVSTRAPARGSAEAGEGERLQKVLARLGVASRREAEEWIRAGRITVNGEVAILGTRAHRSDHLRLDGRLIHRHEIAAGQVYLCHRSPGENLRTPSEPSEHQALVERLPKRAGNRFITVSPMPRIDGGLELVTSDGELAATLQRTIHRLPSEFSVRIRGELNEAQLRGVLEGTLDRGDQLQVESCEPGGGEAANRWYTIVARGGSGKDVRQLFERQGALVSRVLRTKVGALELDRHLSRGQFSPLTKDEIAALTAPPQTATTGQD